MEKQLQSPSNLKEVFSHGNMGLFTNDEGFFVKRARTWYKMSEAEVQVFVDKMKTNKEVQTEPNHQSVVKG